MYDVKCPYCNSEETINHDDGYGYEEGCTHQQQCNSCDKTFVYTTSISFSYDAEKADCLNDGEHIWEPTITHPIEFTKMRCIMCDEERKPTESEMSLIITKSNQRIILRKFPDAYAKKFAALAISIWCPTLNRRLSGSFHTEDDAWNSAVEWLESKASRK